jgi:hypothetical protein
MNERLVKVKGLGTFKIVDVDDRESVNVNTGERVLIEGHSKISFTPDALMKELVNKPFSQFETVVLKDGVVFEDVPEGEDIEEPMIEEEPIVEPKSNEPEPEPIIEPEPETIAVSEPEPEPIIEPEPETIAVSEPEPESIVEPEPEPVSSFYEEDIEPSAAPLVDFVTQEPEKNEEQPQESEEAEESETPLYGYDDEESGFQWKKWLLTAALCCVCFVGGYFVGQHFANKPADTLAAQPEVKSEAKPVAQPKVQPETKPEEQTEVQSEPQTKEQSDPKSEAMPEVKSEVKSEVKPEVKPVAQPESAVELDKYEKMDSRVRTGAYRIVGTDHVEKIKPGDNLARICKRTIGPDMECYLEVYNGIKGDADLKVGQEIKIPKLVHKKKKVKKDN